jgi:hypothetical protein
VDLKESIATSSIGYQLVFDGNGDFLVDIADEIFGGGRGDVEFG